VFIVKFENMQDYSDEQFRRITGVKRTTFEKMLTIFQPVKQKLTSKGGPKPKLCLEVPLLRLENTVDFSLTPLLVCVLL
jgi:hypothetical protein